MYIHIYFISHTKHMYKLRNRLYVVNTSLLFTHCCFYLLAMFMSNCLYNSGNFRWKVSLVRLEFSIKILCNIPSYTHYYLQNIFDLIETIEQKKNYSCIFWRAKMEKKNILLGSFIDIFLFKPMREFVFAILTIPFKYPQQTKNRRIVHTMNNFCTSILSHRIYLKGLNEQFL